MPDFPTRLKRVLNFLSPPTFGQDGSGNVGVKDVRGAVTVYNNPIFNIYVNGHEPLPPQIEELLPKPPEPPQLPSGEEETP